MDPQLLIDQQTEEFIIQKLQQPPFIRLPCTHSKTSKISKLVKENNVALGYISHSLGTKSPLWSELGLLEKTLFLENVRMRSEPLLRGAKQVRKCMRVIKECNIINKISACVESIIGLDGKMLIPSKQYLQYALSTVVMIVKVGVQCIAYCRYTQTNVIKKLNLGHHLNISMVIASIVSRIWVLCHTLIIELQTSYTCLYELHQSASSVPDFTWLPTTVKLPIKLNVQLPSLQLAEQIINFKLIGWSVNGEDQSADESSDINLHVDTGRNMDLDTAVQLDEDMGVVLDRKTSNKTKTTTKESPAPVISTPKHAASSTKQKTALINSDKSITSKAHTTTKKRPATSSRDKTRDSTVKKKKSKKKE